MLNPPYVASFELSVGIKLGPKIDCSGGIGIDILDPPKSFFYVKIKDLTIANILAVYKPNLVLPPWLASTGFDGEAEMVPTFF
jgi:hypothetical protein